MNILWGSCSCLLCVWLHFFFLFCKRLYVYMQSIGRIRKAHDFFPILQLMSNTSWLKSVILTSHPQPCFLTLVVEGRMYVREEGGYSGSHLPHIFWRNRSGFINKNKRLQHVASFFHVNILWGLCACPLCFCCVSFFLFCLRRCVFMYIRLTKYWQHYVFSPPNLIKSGVKMTTIKKIPGNCV